MEGPLPRSHRAVCDYITLWRDGRHFPIDDLNDAIEYLANWHGVITVNNGMDGAGRALLRLVAAEEPVNYRKGIERLAAGFGEMRAAPTRIERNKARTAAQSPFSFT